MTSLVYSRKWRPQRFSDLTGQEHVVTTLRHAVAQQRVGHAYLFCGPRGTGKTTTGRLLAKAVNCRQPEDGDPCDVCSTCMAVTAGNLLDVIEFDAASHRRIDDMRNILDRVNFSPGEGQRKVYIVDEVHMLTTEAANAFLKTLEEPPAHALFVLCTTEPYKLPPTIVSRCQRFDFRRISLAGIVSRLDHVCREEGVAADQPALQALARNAAGSLRDAENMLEQVVVSYGSPVTLDGVLELLGIGDTGQALEIVQCLLAGNSASALGALNRAAWEGADLRQLHRQTLELLRAVMVHQWGAGESLDLPADVTAEVAALASKTDSDRVAKALRLFANVDLRRDAPSPLPLELAMVETCMDTPVITTAPAAPPMRPQPDRRTATPRNTNQRPASAPANSPPPLPRNNGSNGNTETQNANPSPSAPSVADSPTPGRSPTPSPGPSVAGSATSAAIEGWDALVKTLSRAKGRRFNIGALLRDCREQTPEGEQLTLVFMHRSHLERLQEELEDPQSMRTVKTALAEALGTAYELNLVLAEDSNGRSGPSAATESPLVRYAKNLGARIVEDQTQ